MTQDLFCVSFRLKENEKEKKNDNKSWANKSAVSFSLGFFLLFSRRKKNQIYYHSICSICLLVVKTLKKKHEIC